MKDLNPFIKRMPKVELHVHLEGSVQPETLLTLAERNNVSLPANTVEGLRKWYSFRDFNHFIDIYMTISSCLKYAEDIELITQDFLKNQAAQNIQYSEVTFTPYNQFYNNRLSFEDQMAAVNKAVQWGQSELGVTLGVIMDIPRLISPEEGDRVAEWALQWYGNGLVALGLGGPEVNNPPSKYQKAFDRVRAYGVPCILHAGETDGPASIWNAIEVADSRRIGHGVRAVEDRELMDFLKEKQIPLEVCPSSNICLKVFPTIEQHSLPELLDYGLKITINSDDPPMFNTSLTDEFILGHTVWNWNRQQIECFTFNAIKSSLLNDWEKEDLAVKFKTEMADL